jgi:voltage-gated potassium channel Kch
MSNLKSLQSRFVDAEWLKPLDVVLVGLGAVGQGVGLSLLANGYDVVAFDFDEVDSNNVIPQGYSQAQVGFSKAIAFDENANAFIGVTPTVFDSPYNGMTGEVMISAVDSMSARKQIFDSFLASDAKLFIDARMNPVQFQIFCVRKDESQIELYKNHLYSDAEVPEQNCSFKASRHTNQIIHGTITSIVTNYVMNRELDAEVYSVPFLYEFNTNFLLCRIQD